MKNKLIYGVAALAVATLLIISYLHLNNTEPISKTGYYLDTVCTITVYDMDEETAFEVIDEGFETCEKYESLLSKTIEGSDVAKINEAKGQWVTVDEDTIELIKASIEYSELSEGTFDVTIGRLTDLWDFHAAEPMLPDENDILDALDHIDYTMVEINGDEVRLNDSETLMELGGIAKGYIADKVTETLSEMGVTSAVVNLGGNIVTLGSKPSGEDFVIGIERPYSKRTEIIGTVSVSDATVVTSGIYERQFEVDGEIYHHILDVNTGYPTDSDVEAVSLVSKRGMSMDCDALSTICLIIGSEKAKELIESIDDVEAVLITKSGEYIMTEGMELDEQ